MKTKIIFLLLISLILTACQASTAAPGTATPTPLRIITATLPPTSTPYATATPVPATATPTPPPVNGQTSAPINVRSAPALTGNPLGLLQSNSVVQIYGQTADGKWFRIAYEGAPDGFGWAAADFIAVADTTNIPIIDTPTPQADSNANSNVGVTTQQLNVRSGPGVDYDTLGLIAPNMPVTLLGITDGGHWYKIVWEDSPDGTGWIYAPYVQTDATGLPIFVPSEDGTATPLPATSTPTPIPAQEDGDSPDNPLSGLTLDENNRTAVFADDLSAPLGDQTDVIQIAVSSAESGTIPVLIRLECTGGQPEATISPLPLAEPLTCNQPFRVIDLLPNRPYLLTLHLTSPDESMIYLHYSLYLSLP